jgi:hypothetical protein
VSTSVQTISPVKLAKELGIRPQLIYSLIKRGKVQTVQGEKSLEVYPDEVEKVLMSPQKRGKPKGTKSQSSSRKQAAKGKTVSWNWQPRGGRRFGRVDEVEPGDGLATITVLDNGDKMTLSSENLYKGIKGGRYRIENPESLMAEVIMYYSQSGQNGKAEALRGLIEEWGGI